MASIQGIYVALFGRPADPTGLDHWNEVTNGGADLANIGDLTGTAEYQDRFTGLTDTQVINAIYQSLFGRDADPEGLAFFLAELTAGRQTINSIAINILDGAKGADLELIDAKIAAADLFTAALDTEAEIAAYVGNDAAQVGRDFLSGVTVDNPPTVDDANTSVLTLLTNAGQEPDGAGGGGGGGGPAPDTTAPVVAASQSFDTAENRAEGAVIGTVDATDAVGVNTFAIDPASDPDGFFAIDAAGQITLTAAGAAAAAASNDFETVSNTFNLSVTATDAAGNTSDAETVVVNVTNVNEAPTIISSATPAAVAENTTTVLTPAANDPEGETAVFSVEGGENGDLFEIDGSGDLAFKAAPDYEALADTDNDGTSDPLEVVIRATDPTDAALFVEQTVSVTVADANEAPTAVTLTGATTSLAEDTDTTSDIKIADIEITDDALGAETLGLTGTDADKFKIVGTELFLTAGTVLDAETASSFDVQVTVDDETIGAANSIEATSAPFTLTITNVDEAPTITSSATPAAVAENTKTVLIPTATDPEGETAVFTVVGGANQGLFEIDGSGNLAFINAPDYEALVDTDNDGTSDPLEVVIRATDPTDAALFVEQTVSVTVADANEAPTAVTLTGATTSLAEDTDTTSDIKIADIEITDDALGAETLGLTGTDADKFKIVGTELFLTAGTVLDAETASSFDVQVTVDDETIGAANSIEATSAPFTLTITNVDEAPTITSSATPAAVAENTKTVLIPTATDPEGETAVFTVVGGANQDLFEIDASGNLAFINAPDYEALLDSDGDGTPDPLEVVIRATDPDDEGLFDEQTISVTVSDANEAPTAVTLTGATTSLAEDTDTTSDIKIADIEITDDALGAETLGLTGTDADKFKIVGTELFLTAGTVLDAETASSFDVQVTADDVTIGAANSIEATSALFTLTITDVDEAPTIISSATPAAVAENTTTVLTPAANDPEGETAVFSVEGGENGDLFEIDGSGDLAFKAAPDYEALADTDNDGTSDPLEVVIRATDPTDPALFDEQTISVTVADANEAPTAVTLTGATTSLAEDTDTTSDIKIADIEITDDALGAETLGLTGTDADKFKIVGTELFLTAGTVLDAETASSFDVQVTADDVTIGAANSIEATSALFTLTITNVDEAPTIISSATPAAVAENTTTVLTPAATDPEGETAVFSVVDGANQDLFEIDASGNLAFINAPDYEALLDSDGDGTPDPLEVVIRATDPDDEGLFDEQTISVTVSDVDEAPPIIGFRIDGAAAGDQSGFSVSSAGDVNNDGFDDLIVGARLADPNGKTFAGSSYVVYGSATPATTIDLANLGANGFRIDGAAVDDLSGHSVSSAGDFNGDGLDDVIVGAFSADPNGKNQAGSSYVIFGGSTLGATIDLANLGANGFRIDGAAAVDWSGYSVSSAGDVNNDGFDDIIVGALYADPDGKGQAGSSYVIFGGTTPASTIDLANLGANGFRIDGAAAVDNSGISVSSAGDVNSDGFDDLIVGAFSAGPDGKTNAGSSYVIFGSETPAATIDLANLGANGFRIDGAAASDRSGLSVSSAGDVNSDGFDDLIVGAFSAGPDGKTNAGSSYVIFGSETPAATIDLANLGANGFRIDGAAAYDQSGISVSSAGDVNNDGFDDLIVGARLADPNGKVDAGSSYVIFGGTTLGATIDLANLGANGFRIDGAATSDNSGHSVSSAGDVNNDGFDDLIIGAWLADPNGKYDAGSSYVIYGGPMEVVGISLADISPSVVDI
jgi:hypothetical protein